MSTFAGLSALGQIAMNAPDVERAKEFYRDTLGIPFLFGAPGMAFFDLGGVRLMLAKPESPEHDHPGSILYFRVPDIREAHAALTDRGVSFEAPPRLVADMGSYELWMAFFRDSEANLLALMAERAKQALTRRGGALYSSALERQNDLPGAMMSENAGNRIRVILRWIQIKDNKEAAWDDEGEFRFRSKVTTGGNTKELKFPEKGFWTISDHPRRNKVDKIDKILFEGEAGDSLVVELFGEELDKLTANDHLEDYRREYTGPVSSWVGRHYPSDEGSTDPENMSDWRVCYDVEMA